MVSNHVCNHSNVPSRLGTFSFGTLSQAGPLLLGKAGFATEKSLTQSLRIAHLKKTSLRPLSILSGALGLALCLPAVAMNIQPVYESSITSAGNAVAIETVINAAAQDIGSLFSNPGTVIINFGVGTGNFLGETSSDPYTLSYADYTALLRGDAASHPNNTTLASAVANLAFGNDANGAKGIAASSADLRVGLGLSEAIPCCSGADGTITLNSTLLDWTTGNVPAFNGSNTIYDALGTAEHEIDEVLGAGGQGSTLNGIQQGVPGFSSFYGPLDLYRYSALHTPSFTTSASATSYFSVDGGRTSIEQFNQQSSGDYADFGPNKTCSNDPAAAGGPLGVVQDAFSCPNFSAYVTASSPEVKMLESIGYDPASVPEPSMLDCMLLGIIGLCGIAFVPRRWVSAPSIG